MNAPVTDISEDAEALARHVAEWLVERAGASSGRFRIALSGGSTPKRLYECLAQAPLRERMPWDRIHLFWGDERFVPPDHPDSNYRMAREAMIERVPVPADQVRPMPWDGTPDEAAARYEALLRSEQGADLEPGRPLFDVTLLGLGEDGHTASLFPGTAVLEERERWVQAVIGAKPEPRLTLTYPALESSGVVAFLVTGRAKAEMLRRARAGDGTLPAGRLRPHGDLVWFVDRAAETGA